MGMGVVSTNQCRHDTDRSIEVAGVYVVDALLLFISPSYCLFSSVLAGLKILTAVFLFS